MNVLAGGLETIDLFAGLPLEAIREFEQIATWHRYAPGAVIFDQASETLEVYFVLEGAVRIMSYVYSDREVSLAAIPAGNYFGELAAIDGRQRSARAVSLDHSRLAAIEGPRFIDMMLRYPVIALRVLERFARIIRVLDYRVTELSTLTDAQRIYAELVRLAQPDPRRPGNRYIPNVPNHKDLASWTGTTKEQVAQAIGDLAREGVVERKHPNLLVRDWSRLQLLARGG